MNRTTARTFRALAILIVVMAALVFGPAKTLDYWQAWVFLALYAAVSVALSLYLLRADPALLERRMRGGPLAEKEPAQRIIMLVASVGFVALLVVPGLDHRFGWSHMATPFVFVGNALLLLGWYAIYHVFRANSFASATIEVSADQKVVSTGPYAWVRHPMYAGGLVMLLGVPITLGSWVGLLAFAAIVPALAWRITDEERCLATSLPGYVDYQRKVRTRLIPKVW